MKSDKTKIALLEKDSEMQEREITAVGAKLGALDRAFQKFVANDFNHLEQRIIKLGMNLKWHTKIGGAVGGLISGGIMVLINYLIN